MKLRHCVLFALVGALASFVTFLTTAESIRMVSCHEITSVEAIDFMVSFVACLYSACIILGFVIGSRRSKKN